tara:strand:+ start:59 stop:337 length:279 start_codon:yes stop_codon:yes gene_type:complete
METKPQPKGTTDMTIYNTLPEAREAARQASIDNPGCYVHLFTAFGLGISIEKRLHVNAPGDAYGNTYWLNGNEKPFTEAQVIADQNATPALA